MGFDRSIIGYAGFIGDSRGGCFIPCVCGEGFKYLYFVFSRNSMLARLFILDSSVRKAPLFKRIVLL